MTAATGDMSAIGCASYVGGCVDMTGFEFAANYQYMVEATKAISQAGMRWSFAGSNGPFRAFLIRGADDVPGDSLYVVVMPMSLSD